VVFFCTKTGARLIAPGISTTAGGNVPEHDGSPEHEAAAGKALAVIVAERKSPMEAASEATLGKAVEAALAHLGAKRSKPEPQKPPKPEKATRPGAQPPKSEAAAPEKSEPPEHEAAEKPESN